MAELMGTDRRDGHTCVMSARCLGAMFIRGLGEYQITHQLIYMMLVEQEGCMTELNAWLRVHGWPDGIQQLYVEFCTNNLVEMQQQMSVLEGSIIPIYQDLFMEQQFVCPVLGFMEFLHVDWLRQILAWQKLNGCYGRMPVTDFARNYKDVHHLDYQYEAERTGLLLEEEEPQHPVKGSQPHRLGHRSRSRGPKVKGAIKVTNPEQDGVAVIQQSNKLQLVGSGKNTSVHSKGVGGNRVKPKKALPRHVVKRAAANTEVERHISQNINNKVNSDNRRHMQRQQQLNKHILNPQKPSAHNKNNQGNAVDTSQYSSQNVVRNSKKKRSQTTKKPNSEPYVNDAAGFMNNGEGWPMLGRRELRPGQKDGQGEEGFMIRRLRSVREEAAGHLGVSRKLLLERALAGNCLSHKTAVAAGALSQYLRLLVNPGTPEYQAHFRLDGPNVILNPATLVKHLQNTNNSGILLNNNQRAAAPPPTPHVGDGGGQRHSHPVGPRGDGMASRIVKTGRKQKQLKRKNQKSVASPDKGLVESWHVVPRPHPDDIIHSEVNENQDDEDNHPQDYYDADDDQDDPDTYDTADPHNDLPKLPLNVNPQFRYNLGSQVVRRDTKGDEEYEQYVDDEDDEDDSRRVQLDLLNPRRVGEASVPRRVVINVPAGETAREANHDEDTYSYYDKDDPVDTPPRVARGRVKLAAPRVRPRPVRTPTSPHGRTGKAAVSPEVDKHMVPAGVSPPGRLYMVLFVIMVTMLIFMYRFVKKRRIVIRYPRNGFR